MVELYSLKLLGVNGDLTGIDQDIAQLEFESSLIDQSLNLGLDPSMIDSLDMEKIHQKCETNKNDYKIVFDDSGQWTTSGIANSPDDEATEEAASNLTTWGRIKSAEPFEATTNSLPEIRKRNLLSPTTATTVQPRPASLVANFVERQADYECALSDGRILDVNDNEIDFVPESTAPFQKVCRNRRPTTTPLKPPRRTFADLENAIPHEDSGIEKTPLKDIAPDLKFLSLPFEIPSFCQQLSSLQIPSFDDLIRQTKQLNIPGFNNKNFDEKMMDFASPDSGLGFAGPSHVDDWSSLAVLLPKHVVDVCCFFKSNSHFLANHPEKQNSLFVPSNRTTTSEIPRSISHQKTCPLSKDYSADSGIAASSRLKNSPICGCQTQSLFVTSNSHSKLCLSSKLKLHAQELTIIGLPVYSAKRALVERVVEGIAEIVRGSSTCILASALEALLTDGLNDGLCCWDVIEAVTAPGPATSNVFQLVKEIEVSEKPKNSRTQTFLIELLRLRSLDGWLSYVVLKENVLSRLYNKDAFMANANSAYRSLFWRLVESLELLSVIEQRPKKKERGDSGVGADSEWTWGSASRIASDSRIPKSSSFPLKFIAENLSETKCKQIERPETLELDISRTPSFHRSESGSVTPSPAIPGPSSTSQISSTSPSTSFRRSKIPILNSSPLTSITRISTPSTTTVSKTLGAATNALLQTSSSPTRLPLYRRSQYGSRAISQQRPFTSANCRLELRKPQLTTTALNRGRKYY